MVAATVLMRLPDGQECCLLTCLGWYHEVAQFEVARGSWRPLVEWYLELPDNWPKTKTQNKSKAMYTLSEGAVIELLVSQAYNPN